MDVSILHFINLQFSNSFFDIFFPSITDLHKTWQFKFLALPTLFGLLVFYRRWTGFFLFLGLAISFSLSDKFGSVLKHFWQRARPFEVDSAIIQRSPAGGFSFPSNHSINMFCFAVFLAYFFPRYRIPFFIIAFLVAYSRLYNGVHFPSDVMSGALIGSGFGYLGARLTDLWNKRRIRG